MAQSPYPVTMVYKKSQIHLIVSVEPDNSIVYDVDDVHDTGLLSLLVPVRRLDRNEEPRAHDVRVVQSDYDQRKGTLETVLEFSDIFIPLSVFAQVSAEYGFMIKKSIIDIMDPEIIARAITEMNQ